MLCFLGIVGYRELIAAGDQRAQRRFHSARASAYT
jgi:hypothetical protein